MTQITKTIKEELTVGGIKLTGQQFSDTGDNWIEFHESIPAGQSKAFSISFDATELKQFAMSVDLLGTTVVHNGPVTLLSATQYTSWWSNASGTSNPASGTVTSLTVDNTGGGTAVVWRAFFLIENA